METVEIAEVIARGLAGRRVFVTGHTGFKGGWLCHWLDSLGARVAGYALSPPTSPSLFEATGLAGRLTHHLGDLADFDRLAAAMADFAPELVMHLAAQPLVRRSYAQPRETFAANVMGTVHLLEAVRACPSVRAVVNVTSDKCYENREWVWGYRETDPMGGHDPYSASKGCAELVASAWRRSFFAPEGRVALGSVRAGNVIGGGDWGEDRLVPDCIRAFAAGDRVTLRAPGAIRPWQHVLEPIGGYLLLAARLLGPDGPDFAGEWNFGPDGGEARTVEQVVREVARLWGEGAGYAVQAPRDAPHEAHWLKLDCGKANIVLGWRPRYGVDRALAETVDWYRHFHRGAGQGAMRELTLAAIRRYCGPDRPQ